MSGDEMRDLATFKSKMKQEKPGKLRKNVTEKMRETGGQVRDCFWVGGGGRVATCQRLGRQELRIPCGVRHVDMVSISDK